MRFVTILLAALLVVIQWPLWFGKGGWLRVAELERQLSAQKSVNAGLGERNAQVAAEVASLREGRGAIEERARHDLNMVREGETFFQLIGNRADPTPPAAERSDVR
jgi:cell division protein FtsB